MNVGQSVLTVTLGLCFVLAVSCQTSSMPGSSAMPLEGGWEFVSGRYTAADGKVTEIASPQLRAVKTIGNSRFSFISVRADGTFVRAGGGQCTFSGNTYTERLDYASAESMRGKTYSFESRLDGDTWYHSGLNEGIRFEEVWRRAH